MNAALKYSRWRGDMNDTDAEHSDSRGDMIHVFTIVKRFDKLETDLSLIGLHGQTL